MKGRTKKALMILAVLCLVVSVAQSVTVFAANGLYVCFLQTCINTVGVFLKDAIVDMDMVIEALPGYTLFQRGVGYLYMLVLLVAPLCTAAAALLTLRRIFYTITASQHNRRKPRAVVLGDSPWGRGLLTTAAKKYRTVCLTRQELPAEEQLPLLQAGVNLIKEDTDLSKELYKACHMQEAAVIALMETDGTRVLAALRRVCEYLSDKDIAGDISCIFLYDNSEIRELAYNYYAQMKQDHPQLEKLELIPLNVYSQAVAEMLQTCPLYTCNIQAPALATWTPADGQPNPWDVHAVIAGFDTVGSQMLLQTINLGVLHSAANMVIDVFETDMEQKLDDFLQQFAVGTWAALQRDLPLGSSRVAAQLTLPLTGSMDGSLTLRFFDMSTGGAAFAQALDDAAAVAPITYTAICHENGDGAVSTVLALDAALRRQNRPHTPIAVYMPREDGLRQFLQAGKPGFAKLYVGGSIKDTMQPQRLAEITEDTYAMQFNYRYSRIDQTNSAMWSAPVEQDAAAMRQEWLKMAPVKRESSRKLSAHQHTKHLAVAWYTWRQVGCKGADGVSCSFADYWKAAPTGIPAELAARLEKLFSIQKTDALVAALNADPILHEAAALEHRRWTQAQLTMGYAYAPGKKNDELRTNPCILSWDDLCKKLPEYCQYDLMPLLML